MILSNEKVKGKWILQKRKKSNKIKLNWCQRFIVDRGRNECEDWRPNAGGTERGQSSRILDLVIVRSWILDLDNINLAI